ncbi:MAG: hypothetical protein WBI34_12380 [Tenuifilaceae bacterium]|jgi:uncharacterized protein YukE|nr:hypothetical protein [Bacteroidales bacterium]MDI9516908.1 hypothetical protein [Bacteroidota bacterium]OQC63161.1 MAG: hypothetical protein BWX49_01371 [Bacteroidetes bacterium ADurb.Bin008]HNS28956.1 hypothetical protein [Tenuifilaceae bacterium]MZP81877.1 hypothetical protein [Bacteroidales bacterium]
MKKYHLIPLLLLVGIFLFGCGSKEKKVETSTFQPMEVQIPDALKDNPEAVEYIENMSKAVDAYAMALDKLAAEIQKMGIKEGAELSTFQKIKLIQVAATHFQEIGTTAQPLFTQLEEAENMKKDFSDDQLLAFSSVMDRFQARMQELEKKYEKLSNIAEQDAGQ